MAHCAGNLGTRLVLQPLDAPHGGSQRMTSCVRTFSPQKRTRQFARRTLQLLLVGIVVIFILATVVWLVISSVSSPKDLVTLPPRWLPSPLYLDNYREILFGSGQPGTTLTSVTLRAFRF